MLLIAALIALHPGDSGPEIAWLQRRLIALHYDPGEVTGRYGRDTVPAVWAFQKVNRIPPSSTVDSRTWAALRHPRRPHRPSGVRNGVEVDLGRQLLFAYRDGRPALISHISSGGGYTYRSAGRTCRAVTPIGGFTVYRVVHGWRRSRLGYLYNPLYFHGGFALHGEPDVPLRPISHGCVRIPMHTADLLPKIARVGTSVHVRR